MKIAKVLTFIGAVIMAVIIPYGFMTANFGQEGSAIAELYWGKVTLIDIYISFFVFAGWVFYRENNLLKSIVITIFIIILGSFTICLYAFIALVQSKGDWNKFWHGKRIIAQNTSNHKDNLET